METDVDRESPSPKTAPRGFRVASVVLAAAASVVVWVIATLTGVSFEIRNPLVGTLHISVLLVIVSALLFALLAWAVLALLERFGHRPRKTWTIIALVVLVLSIPPVFFLDTGAGTMVALGLMHLVTGLVLIVMLRRGARVGHSR